ncbi:MAG: glycosyltransferase family 4 protein [Candidatus Auribacterota bacterium]
MNILSISTMFPSKAEPIFGIFVKRRLDALSHIVNLTVVSPRPYFPFISLTSRYRVRREIPHREQVNERTPLYLPRFLSFPLVLKPLDGVFLFITMFFFILRHRRKGLKFDLIDAHLAYPEGFAAIWLGNIFNVPVTITLRGHDVNYLPRYPVRKKQVLYALDKADRVFSVCNALRLEAGDLGVDINKIVVASNGVETDLFYPVDKKKACQKVGLDPDLRYILSIGYLIERKGFDLVIDALSILREKYNITDTKVIIIGGRGGERYVKDELVEQIQRLNLDGQVIFIDTVRNEELNDYYNCADVFCLASSHEGWPNVILEALACAVPVVGTNVWGIPEIFGDNKDVGLIVERDKESIAEGLRSALTKKWDSAKIKAFAESTTWMKTAELLKREMNSIISNHKGK